MSGKTLTKRVASSTPTTPVVATRKGKRAAAPVTPATIIAPNTKAAQNVAVDVDALIERLTAANEAGDRKLGKQLRRKLRAAGHRGGLRGGTINAA